MAYEMDLYDANRMPVDRIINDVLTYMHRHRDELELRKMTKRRKVEQAVYGVAKKLGFRSAYHDLYVWHSSRQQVLPYFGEWIPISEITKHNVYFQVMVLGKESKKAYTSNSVKDRLSGNSTMANQIEVDVRGNDVLVEMELTGPALYNLCSNYRKNHLKQVIKDMLKKKWGNIGTKYGLYDAKDGTESYQVVRKQNGMPKVYQQGMGLVTHYEPQSAGFVRSRKMY